MLSKLEIQSNDISEMSGERVNIEDVYMICLWGAEGHRGCLRDSSLSLGEWTSNDVSEMAVLSWRSDVHRMMS